MWISQLLNDVTWGKVRIAPWFQMSDQEWGTLTADDNSEELVNAEGVGTGEYRELRSDPVPIRGNASVPAGTINLGEYGLNPLYDRVVVLEPTVWVDEATHFWLDVDPAKGPHDYEVARIMYGLNHLQVLLKRVNVSG